MDNSNTATAEKPLNGKSEKSGGAGYPFESISDALEHMDKIVADCGTTSVITREEISKSVDKKVNTLGLYFSTWVQYGIMEVVRGSGYKPSALYKKYHDKTYPHHEMEAKLEMFNNAPLYAKIIERLNNQILPIESKFQNILREEPYGINANSAKVAAKVFYENAKELGLLNVHNKFCFSITLSNTAKTPDIPPPSDKGKHDDKKPEYLTLQVPMSTGDLAEIKFPKEYKDEDLDLISAIALAYKKVKKPPNSGSNIL